MPMSAPSEGDSELCLARNVVATMGGDGTRTLMGTGGCK